MRRGLLASALAALAVAAPAVAAPGLPRGYDVKRIDSPNPISGGAFGWGIASGDVTGDGKADLFVAQAQTGPGQVFLFDGVTGQALDTIDPPERNPGGLKEEFGFVYVETVPDFGSCPGGDSADPDEICDAAAIGAKDGIPEFVVGSRSLKINATNGSAAPVAADPTIGRGYIFDGATHSVLKRIDMAPAQRQEQAQRGASPQFARLMMSPQGMAPCGGLSGENNAIGVGPCPATPDAVRIGDVTNGATPQTSAASGQPDLIITARNWVDTKASAPAGSQCATQAGTANCTSGRAWVYAGEDIVGSDPRAILETPASTITNPFAQTGGAEFGGNVFRVGDVTTAGATNVLDGKPDLVIAARTLDYPLTAPDASMPNVGAGILINGARGSFMGTIPDPEPHPRDEFSGSFNSGRAVGDLGSTSTSDILLGAPLHNSATTDDGHAWVFTGDLGNAGGGGEQSFNFATFSDPTPMLGGNFSGSSTGVGDLVGGIEAPANEILMGGFGPFDPNTDVSNSIVTDVHIMNAQTQTNLQTIVDPDRSPGSGFGVGVTPMGDLNGDGFLDFAASAYLRNLDKAGQGRAFIFTSNDTPAAEVTPEPTGQPSPPSPDAGPPPYEIPLKEGACANERQGTSRDEHLRGTRAGDKIFGRGGKDGIETFEGADCALGGSGDDRLDGGSGGDRVLGGSGHDRLYARGGRDRSYGESGDDRLVGGSDADLLAGGRHDDDLRGGPGKDRLFGEGGDDRLSGDTGRNELDGGPGNDRIDARNGKRDVVRCGPGKDVVKADRKDSLNGCERIKTRRRRGR